MAEAGAVTAGGLTGGAVKGLTGGAVTGLVLTGAGVAAVKGLTVVSRVDELSSGGTDAVLRGRPRLLFVSTGGGLSLTGVVTAATVGVGVYTCDITIISPFGPVKVCRSSSSDSTSISSVGPAKLSGRLTLVRAVKGLTGGAVKGEDLTGGAVKGGDLTGGAVKGVVDLDGVTVKGLAGTV